MAATLLTALLLSSRLVNDYFPVKNCQLSETQLQEVQEPLRIFLSEPYLGVGNVSVEFVFGLESTSGASEQCNDSAILLATTALRTLIDKVRLPSKPSGAEDVQQEEGDSTTILPATQINQQVDSELSKDGVGINEEIFLGEDSALNEIKVLIDAHDVEGARKVFENTARNEEFIQQLFIELFDEQWQKKTIGRVYDLAASVRSVVAFEALRQHQQRIGLFEEHPLLVVLFSHRLLQFTRGPDFDFESSDTQRRAYALARDINEDRRRVINEMVRDLIESDAPSAATLSIYALIALPTPNTNVTKAPDMVNEAIVAALPYLEAGKIGVAKLAEMFATLHLNTCPALTTIFNAIGPNATSCQHLQMYLATHFRFVELREKVNSDYFNKNCAPVLNYVNSNYQRLRVGAGIEDYESNINCLENAFKESFVFFLRFKSPYSSPIQKGSPDELSYALQQTNLNDGLEQLYNDIGVTKCHLLAAYVDVLREAKLSHKAATLVTLAQAQQRLQIVGVDSPEGKVCTRAISEAPLWVRRIVRRDVSVDCSISNFATESPLALVDRDGNNFPIPAWNVTFDNLGRPYLNSELDSPQMYIESTNPETPLYMLFQLTDLDGDQVQIKYMEGSTDEPGFKKYLWNIECSSFDNSL